MIVTKPYKLDENDNVTHVITFSTDGLKIKKVKANNSKFKRLELYDYAIDFVTSNYKYEETKEQVKHVPDIIMEYLAKEE